MNHWFFQANPKHYDLDRALVELDELHWRVPQYTDVIKPGDVVAIWRSGKDPGVAGVGRVATLPAVGPVPSTEGPFVLAPTSEGAEATRVVLRVRAIELVPKAVVAGLAEFGDHQIIRAPMGTVFPMTHQEWSALNRVMKAEIPDLAGEPGASPTELTLPRPFSWADRSKDTYPLPGGYTAHIDSLQTILRHVQQQRPSVDELADTIRSTFDLSPTNARMASLFLRRAGFVEDHAGRLQVSKTGEHVVATGDGRITVAQLHARVRFIGEMLQVVAEQPLTAAEILAVANDRYAVGWTTSAQITRRRGWLQSAGMIDIDRDQRLHLTDAGATLVRELRCEPPHLNQQTCPLPNREPGAEAEPTAAEQPAELSPATAPATDTIADLIERLEVTGTAGDNPDEYERALCDAFTLLGYRAERLGGAGRTDVIADAELGTGAKYRVIIDGKTTSRGAVGDHQIDWDTLDDHRQQHSADHVIVAGPAFQGDRVRRRAVNHDVVLLSTTDLAGLLRQHAAMPLTLDDYRALFTAAGDVDLSGLATAVEEQERFLAVAFATLHQIEEHASEVGALSARDLFLLLRAATDLDAAESEIADTLAAMASPLFRLLVAQDGYYRPSSTRRISSARLRKLAARLETDPQPHR